MLEIIHRDMVIRFTKKVYKESEEVYMIVEKHVAIINSSGDPEDTINIFGRSLYDSYTEFMPLDLNEVQKDDWIQKLGEASTYAKSLETVFKRHLDGSKIVTKFILHREIGSKIMEAAQRAAGLYDPPSSMKIMATVRNQLLRWKHEQVITDDNSSNSTVIAKVLQLREEMATLLRNRKCYNRDTFPRICRETYASLREDVRAFLYGQRLALAAQENMIKQSRRNMAFFILMQMSQYNENTLSVIRRVLEKATFHAYTDKLISFEVLNKAAKALPYGDVVTDQADHGEGSSSKVDETGETSETGETRETGETGKIEKAKDDSAPSTSQAAVSSSVDAVENALEQEVVTLKAPTFELLDPTETFRQPRAFTRPPPKAGRKRKYVSVPKIVAEQKCDEEMKELERQQEEEAQEVREKLGEPQKKQAKKGKKRCKKGKKRCKKE